LLTIILAPNVDDATLMPERRKEVERLLRGAGTIEEELGIRFYNLNNYAMTNLWIDCYRRLRGI